MRSICNLCSSLCFSLQGDQKNRETQRTLDGALRLPLLVLIKSAAVWMLLALVFGLIASIKLYSPGFMGECPLFTYGKVEPIFWNTLVYGWLFNAGLACGLFLLSRLGGAALGATSYLTIAIVLWNLAVVAGMIGIFAGDQLPYRLLEFPSYIAPLFFIAFLGMGIWAALAFRERAYRANYASQWWILTALFGFAWVYSAAQGMLVCSPAQGALQALVNSWYVENVLGLAVAPLAFATIYYLIPKTLGVSVVGYRYSGIAFWFWVLFTSFAGGAKLAHGPIPVWVSSLGIIATFGLLLPTTTLSIQFLSSLLSHFGRIWDSVSARFLFVGCVAFTIGMLFKCFGALRGSLDVAQFSVFDSGVTLLLLLGFAGMIFTGAIYFILPRLLNKRLPSTALIDLQFWSQTLGVILISISLISGGLQQGAFLNQSVADGAVIVNAMRSSYFMASLGFSLSLAGAIACNATFFWMLCSGRSEKESSTGFIEEAPELEYTAS